MVTYNVRLLRQRAELAMKNPQHWAVPVECSQLLVLLDDLERYRDTLEHIVHWDYDCADKHCGAGDVAVKAFEGEGRA